MAIGPELRHLRSFVVTAELEHFGRAAERLSIVQPALSRQMRDLETAVGTALFERLPRGVRLSAAGRAYLGEARAILAAVEQAGAKAREVAAGRTGLLRIGFVDTTVYHPRLPAVIAQFRQRKPEVRLELVQQTSRELGEHVRDGRLDVAFVFHLPDARDGLRERPVQRETVRVALPASHALARRPRLHLRDLAAENFVWIPRTLSPVFHDTVVAACRQAGFTPRVVQEGASDLAILSLVAVGAGLTFCVESTALRLPKEVVLRRVGGLDVEFQLRALWRADSANPALPALLERLPR